MWGRRVCRQGRIGYSSSGIAVAALAACWWHADVAQLVEHHLAKVRVAGSNPVVRSRCRKPSRPRRTARLFGTRPALRSRPVAEWPSGLGKGLQSPVRGFDSRFRLAGG